jgi:thioredoxin-related protein
MKKYFFILIMFAFFNLAATAQKTPATADEIVAATVAKAKQEHKKALVMFHASWCEWCKKMDASINDSACKDYFYKNFAISVIDVFEYGEKTALNNPGGDSLYEKYGGNNGLPFWIIFDENGNALATANLSKTGESIACPNEEDDVNAFVNVLKKYTPITPEEAKAVHDRFVKNKVPQ